MFALLLAASIALPPGVLGEWEGVEPDQKVVVYRTGINLTTGRNPDKPQQEFGFLAPFMTGTSNPRVVIAGAYAQHYCEVNFLDDGNLTIGCYNLDIDATVYSEFYRFTRKGLSDS